MNEELVQKVTGMVMEELRALQINQSKGIVKLWPHQHPPAEPISLTKEAVIHETLQGEVRFSVFPESK